MDPGREYNKASAIGARRSIYRNDRNYAEEWGAADRGDLIGLCIRRIGFVASEITKNGGIAICAPIAPYRSTRRAVREMIEDQGAFIEIHVATPLEVCEARDRKGLYAKARLGLIPEFSGISDPYEVPEDPEMRIDTSQYSAMEAVHEIYLYLLKEGYL
ncbi:MAG: adenylyl-sulfate kinase [Gammaproteobacteria bacterium]|nr:adenylyl-sulfate kinase [Gammaproteobacteria bacterium]